MATRWCPSADEVLQDPDEKRPWNGEKNWRAFKMNGWMGMEQDPTELKDITIKTLESNILKWQREQ